MLIGWTSLTNMLSLGTFLLLAVTCFADNETSKSVKQFNNYLISPLIIPAPPMELSVRFSSEKVDMGNKIPAYSASIPPYIYYDAEPGSLYTIIFFDADAPSTGAPIDGQFVQALLVNIEENKLEQCDYLTPYIPVAPAPGSGYHRLVILLFKQSRRIDTSTPELRNLHKNPENFSVKLFAQRYGLGDPVAGNFFLYQLIVCDKDEDVPQLCSLY